MNQRDPNDGARTDAALSDVERLLEGMSLKSPSQMLDGRMAHLGQQTKRPRKSVLGNPWFPQWGLVSAVGLTCLLTGFFMGRFSQRPQNNDALAAAAQANGDDASMPNTSMASTEKAQAEPASMLNKSNGVTAATTEEKASLSSKVRLIDEGLFLLDGKIPVRRYVAVSEERIQVIDKDSGKPVEVVVPVKKSFVQRAYGT